MGWRFLEGRRAARKDRAQWAATAALPAVMADEARVRGGGQIEGEMAFSSRPFEPVRAAAIHVVRDGSSSFHATSQYNSRCLNTCQQTNRGFSARTRLNTISSLGAACSGLRGRTVRARTGNLARGTFVSVARCRGNALPVRYRSADQPLYSVRGLTLDVPGSVQPLYYDRYWQPARPLYPSAQKDDDGVSSGFPQGKEPGEPGAPGTRDRPTPWEVADARKPG
ncbi:hypothetical protein BT67DRAFT_150715 [Trichocladium antarcticum]|uniref:Uncharacterized protein n=1 Tax=Trichocladium antarcticum TaxID=1450529 RepID=A0AAN6UFE5_9PEZI|nr:hypothetical protein BT67DRAFT_150715 [Trichocladium antarcticum]